MSSFHRFKEGTSSSKSKLSRWWGGYSFKCQFQLRYVIFDSRQRLDHVGTRSALLGLIKQQYRDTFIDKLVPDFGSLSAPTIMIMLGKDKTFPPGILKGSRYAFYFCRLILVKGE
ncbi:hypothetical protein CDAR_587441 [Caerostris darwini]|uniref:Uncharacterized protein n=1 Tax=Caerostris darwini TaxID=1538125 RepID=A0AAV4SLC4_9ARAC|nr:hypothetical protein CDAR_587441 [Caerostris darwini]